MANALIYNFSGTGNTGIATNFIAEQLTKRGYEVRQVKITYPFLPPPSQAYDVVGFGYPVHAFNTPQIVLKYAKLLPDVDNVPTFIFKTSGEPFKLNNASSYSLYRILSKKGYHVLTDTHLLMPYNILFRYPDSLAKQMYLHTKSMAKQIVDKVLSGKSDKIHYSLPAIMWSMSFRVEWLGTKLNGRLIKATDKCVGCGKCVKICPMNNISLVNGVAKFGHKCTMCMACAMACPQNAVKAGIVNRFKVNGNYDFEKLASDDSIPGEYITSQTKGYFKTFLKYYKKNSLKEEFQTVASQTESVKQDIDAVASQTENIQDKGDDA
ncbi:MAG: EFR1 family ferrodoxin [Clostridia bacterium]